MKRHLGVRRILKLIQFWGPYLFSGIKVVYISKDLHEIKVRLKTSFWNSNYFGTHYGGSLFSMCDPFYVFIVLDKMSKEHIAWDKSSEIDFVKAVKEPVFASFKIESELIEKFKSDCLENFKIEPVFETDVVTASGEVVARIKKKIYIRRKDAKSRFTS